MAQVVEVAVGDRGEALEARLAEQLPGALAELARGRTGQRAVIGVERRQRADVGARVAPREGPGGRPAPVADLAGGAELGDQAGDLLARAPGHAAQIAHDHPLVGLAQARIAEMAQRVGDEGVARLAPVDLDIQGLAAVEKGANLFQGLKPSGLQSHDHPPMIPTPPP